MATLVYGAGTSHTPMLAIPAANWLDWAGHDRRNDALTLTDGRTLSYQALLETVGEAHDLSIPTLEAAARTCQAALDRLADDLAAAQVDAIVIIGDDQEELFGRDNLPLVSVYFGDELVMHAREPSVKRPAFFEDMNRTFAMDDFHRFPGHPALALDIITGLLDRDVDVSSAARVTDPAKAGFGHAYGFIIQRLFKGRRIPVVPILLNTYYPPNVPSAARAFAIGEALRTAVEQSPVDCRVAIIASGGLSHFVVDPALDARIIEGLRHNDAEALTSIPRAALRSGASEILNWIVAAGALHGATPTWLEYQPLYRSPAGTGVGATFMSWRDPPRGR